MKHNLTEEEWREIRTCNMTYNCTVWRQKSQDIDEGGSTENEESDSPVEWEAEEDSIITKSRAKGYLSGRQW